MMRYERSTHIAAPVGRVWEFHERPDAIELLRPPWQRMRVLERHGGLEPGSRVVFEVWMGPLPVTWVADHVDWNPGRLFVDEQTHGPFRSWRHEHHMDPERDGTLLRDVVTLSPPGGRLTELVAPWAVRAQLERLFAHRHEVIKTWCERGELPPHCGC